MSETANRTEQFDVFLCHNWDDKAEIRRIAQMLSESGVKPWLDEEQIRPGTSWQTALGEQIEHINAAAVFVGESGIGPWQSQEIQALLSQFVNRKCPVIPVVLPTAKETPKLPWTLQNVHWVDFRKDHPDPMGRLIWGVTGIKPSDKPEEAQPPVSDIPVEKKELFPPQEKKIIEIRIPGSLDDFSDEEKEKLLQSLTSIMEIGDVKLTRAVAGSIRLYLELEPEGADKLHSALNEGLLDKLGIKEVKLYPALPDPPEDEQRSQLMILLDRVKEYWIEGVLKNSLYHEVLISLGKRAMDEAVRPPVKHFVELSKQRHFLNLKSSGISTVFDATGLLLILGEPGSGKTTTMLDLASNLIARAKEDSKERIPIVLNLSSWKKHLALDEWIAEELSAKYRVPRKIGRSWLENDYILPMLDGLDEVKNAEQPDCVAAINKYIAEYEPAGLIVCCRLMEYQWLPERLKLNGAICLELLGPKEVEDFIASVGAQLDGLRQAMQTDLVIQELAKTPLMLSILSLAFEGKGREAFDRQRAAKVQERRKQIFNIYIDRMFERKEQITQPFPKAKVLSWLSCLAKGMKEHSQSVLMVENLQPSWLVNRSHRVLYGFSAALLIAVIYGLIIGLIGDQGEKLKIGLTTGMMILLGVGFGCWSKSKLRCSIGSAVISGFFFMLIDVLDKGGSDGLFGGLIGGLIGGMVGGVGVGSLMVVSSVEKVHWQWKKIFRVAIPGLIIGLVFGLIFGLIVGLSYYLENGLEFGLIGGLIGGTCGGLLCIMTDTVSHEKMSPNQGIKLSLKNAIISTIIIGLSGGIIVGLSLGRGLGLIEVLSYGLNGGLLIGPIGGLNRGGSAVIKHYSLRLVLWIKGYTPFNLTKFLDYSAKLILLKKVGGGYMFIHRMLLEHFADMDVKKPKTE